MKFEHTEVFNIEGSLRGMRNPLNSWDKSDSEWEFVEDPSIINPNDEVKFVIGENDMKLAQRLILAGSEHRKFLRQIFIRAKVEANIYEWLKMENKFIEKTALPDNIEDLTTIKRTIIMNYEVAYSTKYKYGKDYDEWLKTLPYADELIFCEVK